MNVLPLFSGFGDQAGNAKFVVNICLGQYADTVYRREQFAANTPDTCNESVRQESAQPIDLPLSLTDWETKFRTIIHQKTFDA